MRTALLAVTLLASTAALAEDTCTIEAGPRDVVQKSGDVTIEPGRDVEAVYALDGNVVLKKGAKVKSVLAFHGDVTVEDGAQVTDDVIAISGEVKVAKGASVKSSIEVSQRGLRVQGDDHDDVAVNLSVGGKSLAERIAEETVKKVKDCRIVAKKD